MAMLRKMQPADLDQIMQIWLNANLQAHDFIVPDYWQENLPAVRQALPQAEVYVYAQDNEIWGFIGLQADYIAGIFVDHQRRNQGVGKKLLDYAKSGRKNLTLNVYQQNKRAVNFYQREDFQIIATSLDENTNATELKMRWQAQA